MARSLLTSVLVAVAVLAAGTARAKPFVFASLPDTQIYADDRFPGEGGSLPITEPRGTGAIFFDQTQWLVDNADALGIRYVGHLGDIVQDGNKLEEWALAHEAMDLLLQADLPHGTVMGNHDDNHGPDYQRNYLDHFGPQFYADRSWYTASSPGGGANVQMLEHGAYKLGFLNFSIDHPQSEIDWATDFVTSNPDTIFVIGTHRYLYDFKLGGGRFGEDVLVDLIGLEINLPQGFVPGIVEGNSAEELFREFVQANPNVLMIHAGHFHSEWLRRGESNLLGNEIVQILTDYQSTRNGGDGWLRLYELDFDAGQLRFHTYSPTLDRRRTVMDHFVETIYLIWAEREQIKDVIGFPSGPAGDPAYLQLIPLLLKQAPDVPDGLLLDHPDFDEPEERAYYEAYLDDLFEGEVPAWVGEITEWEKLWLFAFAADPDDLSDFGDGPRSPSGVVDVDFMQYFTPSPEQLLVFAFDDLIAALRGLSPDDLFFASAGDVLAKKAEVALRLAKRGHVPQARRFLERTLVIRTDGCAERGEPDGLWRFFWPIFQWIWAWFNLDWVDTCAGQAQVAGPLAEVLGLLE